MGFCGGLAVCDDYSRAGAYQQGRRFPLSDTESFKLKRSGRAKLDFKRFSKHAGIRRRQEETGDAREEFADLIHRYAGGIKAHALAFRIYGSAGEDCSEEEVAVIRRVAEGFRLPGFIGGLYGRSGINDKKEE